MEQEFINLLIKKNNGELSLPEQKELLSLMQKLDGAEDTEKSVSEIFKSSISFDKSIPEISVNKSTEQLLARLRTGTGQRSKVRLLDRKYLRLAAVAASVLMAVGLGWIFFYQTGTPKQMETNIVSTQRNSKSNVILPDGTKVWINGNSKLTYEGSFRDGERVVDLTGEAYFDVVKDEKRPFIVRTKTMNIKVLGTAFNVRSYDDEQNAQTTLIRGSVEVLIKKSSEKVVLRPSEKVIVQNDSPEKAQLSATPDQKMHEVSLTNLTINRIDSGVLETQWIKNQISFDKQKLEDIIPMLESWYGVKISVVNPALLQKRFSGKIQNESLSETLQLFKLTSKLEYKIEGNNVTIYK